MRPGVLKWSKKEKLSQLEELRLELDEGQVIAFITIKPDHWMVLMSPIKGHIDGTITDITQPVAGLLGRSYCGQALKGLKYDSPDMMAKELQELFEFKKSFQVSTF